MYIHTFLCRPSVTRSVTPGITTKTIRTRNKAPLLMIYVANLCKYCNIANMKKCNVLNGCFVRVKFSNSSLCFSRISENKEIIRVQNMPTSYKYKTKLYKAQKLRHTKLLTKAASIRWKILMTAKDRYNARCLKREQCHIISMPFVATKDRFILPSASLSTCIVYALMSKQRRYMKSKWIPH
jgi:hypothetical protein